MASLIYREHRGGGLGCAHLVETHITCFFLILLRPWAAQMVLLGE